MRKIYSKWIPFKGHKAMTLFGWMVIREEYKDEITKVDVNHEEIHNCQGQELIWGFFYVWYFIEWFIKLFKYGKNAHRETCFEREAYAHEHDMDYVQKRAEYAWLDYVFSKGE